MFNSDIDQIKGRNSEREKKKKKKERKKEGRSPPRFVWHIKITGQSKAYRNEAPERKKEGERADVGTSERKAAALFFERDRTGVVIV